MASQMLALEIVGEGNALAAQRGKLGAALGDDLVFVLWLGSIVRCRHNHSTL
jgi:hypothetical protein